MHSLYSYNIIQKWEVRTSWKGDTMEYHTTCTTIKNIFKKWQKVVVHNFNLSVLEAKIAKIILAQEFETPSLKKKKKAREMACVVDKGSCCKAWQSVFHLKTYTVERDQFPINSPVSSHIHHIYNGIHIYMYTHTQNEYA